MKKILLVLGVLAISVSLQAQQPVLPVNPNTQNPLHHPQFDAAKFMSNKGIANAKRSMVDEYWLNYGISIDQLDGGGIGAVGPSVLSSNYLFPDSLCYGNFGGTYAPVWVHHLGDILDVKSTVFNQIDGETWDATTTFSLDSMSILYSYTRAEAVTDSLVITLITNASPINMPGYYFYDPTFTANYYTDTVSFRDLKYTQSTNSISAIGAYKFSIPLTELDTAIALFRELQFAVPSSFVVPAGKLLGVDIQFKPGYTYALGDSIDTQHNAFYFASYEEWGAGTYQTYYDCDQLAADCDYNCSFIVPHDVRYNTAGTFWNGKFIPSYAYTVDYAFEHHLISYKVTSPPLGSGINEIKNDHFALMQNQPNPFVNQTNISYQLKKSAKNVSIEISDIRGVKMYEKTQTNINPGNYSYDIKTNNFAAGVYFCTLTVDGEKLTNKIVKQ